MDQNPSDLWQDGYDARHPGRPVSAGPIPPDADIGVHSEFKAEAARVHGCYAADRGERE